MPVVGPAHLDPGDLGDGVGAVGRFEGAGQEAVLLVVGAVPILVLAGLIEGFISPSGLPDPLKLLIGPIAGIALHLFLLGPIVWRQRWFAS